MPQYELWCLFEADDPPFAVVNVSSLQQARAAIRESIAFPSNYVWEIRETSTSKYKHRVWIGTQAEA